MIDQSALQQQRLAVASSKAAQYGRIKLVFQREHPRRQRFSGVFGGDLKAGLPEDRPIIQRRCDLMDSTAVARITCIQRALVRVQAFVFRQ